MNISITIPQIFYDIIARVFPGYIFVFVLKVELLGTGVNITNILDNGANNSVDKLLNGIGFLIICYFIGWILNAFTFLSYEEDVKKIHEEKLKTKNKSISFYEMYHTIRLKNATEGFRIIKLRAEARMLETSRTGMIIILFCSVCIMFITKPSFCWNLIDISFLIWIGKLILPFVLFIGFRKSEKSAWNRYYGNISSCYELIIKMPNNSAASDS